MIFDYPQIGTIKTKELGDVPLLDIKMMSDLDCHKMCLKSRLDNPELYREVLNEDVEAVIEKLKRTIKECEAARNEK